VRGCRQRQRPLLRWFDRFGGVAYRSKIRQVSKRTAKFPGSPLRPIWMLRLILSRIANRVPVIRPLDCFESPKSLCGSFEEVMGMLFEHYTERGIDIVKLTSRMMPTNQAEARALAQIIRDGSGRIVLDLSLVEYTDGSGLAFPVSALKYARQRGGDVHLVMATHTPVSELFELTRLGTVFRVYADVASAVSAFSPDESSPSTPT
jgi:anti-anti-sigma factor